MPTQNNRHTISDLYQMQSLPLEIKVRMTQRRIRDWVEYWGEDGVYVSFSGGKDSTVLLDICRRMYPNIVAVYSDTGLEFPEIREFVKTKDNVVWVRPELTFRKVIEKCGYPCISKEQAEWIHRIRLGQKNTRDIQKYFYGIRTNGQPSRFKISERWKFMLNAPFDIGAGCCNEMKKKPIAKYAKETGRVPIVGTMACESSLRTSNWLRYGCNAYDNKKATSAPLSFWTDADIWEYIRTYDIPYCKIAVTSENADDDNHIILLGVAGVFRKKRLHTLPCPADGFKARQSVDFVVERKVTEGLFTGSQEVCMDNERTAVITIGDEEYTLLLTTKATKEIAGRYGGLENLGEKLMKSENFEMAIGEIVWLITLLANQSILIHNLKDKEHPKEPLTEDVVELLTTPLDLAGYKTAITEALYKGTKRNVESEKDAKNAQVG